MSRTVEPPFVISLAYGIISIPAAARILLANSELASFCNIVATKKWDNFSNLKLRIKAQWNQAVIKPGSADTRQTLINIGLSRVTVFLVCRSA
jgi:hypothetical protein